MTIKLGLQVYQWHFQVCFNHGPGGAYIGPFWTLERAEIGHNAGFCPFSQKFLVHDHKPWDQDAHIFSMIQCMSVNTGLVFLLIIYMPYKNPYYQICAGIGADSFVHLITQLKGSSLLFSK